MAFLHPLICSKRIPRIWQRPAFGLQNKSPSWPIVLRWRLPGSRPAVAEAEAGALVILHFEESLNDSSTESNESDVNGVGGVANDVDAGQRSG